MLCYKALLEYQVSKRGSVVLHTRSVDDDDDDEKDDINDLNSDGLRFPLYVLQHEADAHSHVSAFHRSRHQTRPKLVVASATNTNSHHTVSVSLN